MGQSKAAEVSFGQGAELRILQRWLRVAGLDTTTLRVIRSRSTQDWDFVLLGPTGLPVAYIEIKLRRQSFEQYGDAMCPTRKHLFAQELARHNIPFLMVVEHPDALIEVDLVEEPAREQMVRRRDRPGTKPVPHALYSREQINVLDPPEDEDAE